MFQRSFQIEENTFFIQIVFGIVQEHDEIERRHGRQIVDCGKPNGNRNNLLGASFPARLGAHAGLLHRRAVFNRSIHYFN